MRKETYDTIVTCYKKLLLVDIDPDSLNDDQISEISRLSQEISQRAIQLRECAQTLHRNAKSELEALKKVVVEFLTTGKYNKKTFSGMIGLLVSGSRSVSNEESNGLKRSLVFLYCLYYLEWK
ncbi:MAG: hypothetical protein MMC33_010659 [Icmadophila ericetorum]|nr:hypothetical protein [Icmadophila ericetorum]